MLHRHPRELMCLKPPSGVGKGDGKVRTYSGDIVNVDRKTRNIGFGDFTETTVTETREGEKMLNAVQRAAVGTVITVSSRSKSGFSAQEEIYRITGTTHNKRLIGLNDDAKDALNDEYEDRTTLPLTNRRELRSLLTPMWEQGRRITIQRRVLTTSERAEARDEMKREREQQKAERRQYRINFEG